MVVIILILVRTAPAMRFLRVPTIYILDKNISKCEKLDEYRNTVVLTSPNTAIMGVGLDLCHWNFKTSVCVFSNACQFVIYKINFKCFQTQC